MIAICETVRKWLGGVDTVHAGIRQEHKRGRPYLYSTTVIIRCYLLMLLYPRVRKHAALQAFLCQHGEARMLVGLETVPHRTTLSRRCKTLGPALQTRISAMGLAFVLHGCVELHILMADGTLHRATGPSWPAKYQKQGVLPHTLRHVDRCAGWGKSPYHGWVWGYRTHPVVALNQNLEPIPLLADAQPGNVQDNTILARQLPSLPADATVLLLDSSYEDEALVRAWQQYDEGILMRWLIVDPKKRPGRPAPWRQQLQISRLLEEADLYGLRSKLMEPFFAHWKEAFDLAVVPLQGKDACAYLLLALYGYQLLIWDNLQTGRPTYAYRHLVLGFD
jgi:hypothetical protein